MMSTANAPQPGSARLRLRTIALTAAALAAAWAFDAFVLRTGLLAPIHGRPAWSPLYAAWELVLRPSALIFFAWGAVVVCMAPRTCDPARVSPLRFALAIAATSMLSSFALFLVREDPSAFGALFDHYQHEEFLHDARAIVDPLGFLGHYVELMPGLSTHGRHFPPGNALLLSALMRIFGDKAAVAGCLSLSCVGLGCMLAYRASTILCGDARARQAAWFVASAPALLDFGSASMDAVFFAVAAGALWLSLRAIHDVSSAKAALCAGAALFVATFFSFSAFPLGLLIVLYALFRLRIDGHRVLLQLAWLAVAWAFLGLCVWLATGFSIVECAGAAARSAHDFMSAVAERSTNTDQARIFFGNGAAFALMAGVGSVSALASAFGARSTWSAVWTRAVLLVIATMCALYYLETERIWLFVLPWVAAITVIRSPWDAVSMRRILFLNLLQAGAFELGLFTLW